MTSDLMTAEEAAEYLNVEVQTLAVWRCHKTYDLPYIKVGRRIRYRKADLDAWIESRRVVN